MVYHTDHWLGGLNIDLSIHTNTMTEYFYRWLKDEPTGAFDAFNTTKTLFQFSGNTINLNSTLPLVAMAMMSIILPQSEAVTKVDSRDQIRFTSS